MQFLVEHSIYVTLTIAVMIMLGTVLYLSRLDARLRKLEREVQR